MNKKLYYTTKILNNIFPLEICDMITKELIKNDERANDNFYLGEKRINFGKYKNKTFRYLTEFHYNYCLWVIKQGIIQHPQLKDYIEYKSLSYKNNIKFRKKKYYY